MEERIIQTLARIEKERNISILYACETGSRAWGFPSPDSDFDIRIIYKHEQDWYLTLLDRKGTLEYMSEDKEIDLTGWDIKKCLELLWKSNGALLERIQSPIVYKAVEGFIPELRQLADQYYSPIATMHHYLGMASKSFKDVDEKEEVRLKTLFYALRAALACKWIQGKEIMPPIEFLIMVNELNFEEKLKDRIRSLIQLKSGKNEAYIHPKEVLLNEFIREQIKTAKEVAGTLPGRKGKKSDLDDFFRKTVKAS